ncbi:MAG: hypothetical protein U0271_37095 [Polyangiaceae bacterium]
MILVRTTVLRLLSELSHLSLVVLSIPSWSSLQGAVLPERGDRLPTPWEVA